MNGNNNNNDDDNASQGSHRSGASLLDRIRLQREREARQQQQQQASQQAPTTMIQVPQYNPTQVNNDSNGYFSWESNGQSLGHSSLGTGEFFSNAWSNISQTMETGMASLQQQDSDDLDSSLLLPPSHQYSNENYSMATYFMTFVKDFYGGFVNMPMAARVAIVLILLYIAIKLL